jgi:hypothetical protein
MEHSSYASKARCLFAKRARTMALVFLPLAAAANAHATNSFVTLPTGNFICSVAIGTSSGCSGDTGDAQLPAENGIAGVSFFTLPGQEIDVTPFFGGIQITMTADGTLNQTLTQNVPVSWDFTLSTTGTAVITTWSNGFNLGTSSGDNSYGDFGTSGNGGGNFTGSGIITLLSDPSGGSTLYETFNLVIETSGTGDVLITAPFDFGVPEPATAGMFGAGLGLLAWLFRRRNRA